jgi:glycosyltransferase involved in cell wall biosynthesis
LIINDGSQDNSSDIVKEKQKQYQDKLILLASHTINRGGGAANQTGYNFVKKY